MSAYILRGIDIRTETLLYRNSKNEIFYVYDYDAKREDDLADGFCEIRDGVYELYEFKKNGLSRIKDEDIPNMTYHMKAITEILQKYKEK